MKQNESSAASTTGNPQKAGMCPRCGGQLYAGLTHVCTTGVRSAATGGDNLATSDNLSQARSAASSCVHVSDPTLVQLTVTICTLCLGGKEGECHVPGCVFWMCAAPTAEQAQQLVDQPFARLAREAMGLG